MLLAMSFRRPPIVITLLLVFAIPLLYALFTNHAWEDYYITLRASRNLVEGHGLVFNPGEHVHSFTSPLGVLVPAFFTWITGANHEIAALWCFRVLNAGLLCASALLVWRRFDTLGIGPLSRCFFYGVAFADSKLVEFSMNGMETAILVFFTLLLWSELEHRPAPRIPAIAAACAGLLWTRPDAFIIAGALLVPHLIFREQRKDSATIRWRPIVIGILIGGACYVPWFTWAWWYYGSPIPNTIIAKAQVTPPFHPMSFLWIPKQLLLGDSMLMDLFLPAYWFYGNWSASLRYFAVILSTIAVFLWLIPRLPAPGKRLSLTLFLGMFYICAIILFPWYSPPWMLVAALALACSLNHVIGTFREKRRQTLAVVLRVGAVAAVAIQLLTLAAVGWEMRIQQRIIEDGIRKDIGLWLRASAQKGDTVFMECLGYIGYYSQLKTYDYPGLSSPEVVSAIKGGSRRFAEVIALLKPTWLVLRPFEIADPGKPENAALLDYEVVREWDGRAKLDAIAILPGRSWLEHDARFIVLRRKSPEPRVSATRAADSAGKAQP